MERFAIVFLTFTSVFGGIDGMSADQTDGLVRLPVIRRSRRAAGENGASTSLRNYRGFDYTVPVDIGTPPQTLFAVLDSGSSDLWVSDVKTKNTSHCDDNKCDENHFFDETKSTTFKKTDDTFSLHYQGFSAKGPIGIDTVSIGGLTIIDQRFGYPSTILWTKMDGIFGVSYALSAEIDKSTVLDRMLEQGQIKKRVFCTRMPKDNDGELILGGCDVEADSWIPISIKDYWKVNITKIVLRSKADGSELLRIDTNEVAVFDTGAALELSMPTRHLNPILDGLPAKYTETKNGNHYLVDCDSKKDVPNMELHFGDVKIVFDIEDYSWTYNGECQVGLRDNGDSSAFLFGALLFNKGTFIFDMDNNRIGLAEMK